MSNDVEEKLDVSIVDFNDVDEVQDEFDEAAERKIPSRQDAEWTDYVMAEVSEDELFGGMPRVETLRRLVEKFIGHISETNVNMQYMFNPTDGKPIAIATANVVIQDYQGNEERYSGIGDATIYNTGDGYRKYLCAIAETRAKGRAFKEALMLQGIVSEEEIGFNERSAKEEGLSDDPISDTQEDLINRLAKRKKVNVPELIEKVFEKSIDLDKLTTTQAVLLIKELNGS